MREILFRGKRIDNGEWVEGLLSQTTVIASNKPAYVALTIDELVKKPFDGCWHEVDPETVGQFTGQPDNNGKKIFEGDILRGYLDSALKRVGVVVFDDGRWEVHSQSGLYISELTEGHELEVIGNIHDNPELLTEKEE